MDYDALIQEAKRACQQAYAPYSGIMVGAALLCVDGSVYTGCNVENAAYGETICAERVAITKAISDGKREFSTIAVACPLDVPITPCGACRQVMAEFCDASFPVVMARGFNEYDVNTLGELLPQAFNLNNH